MKKLIILSFFALASFSVAAQKDVVFKLRWTDSPYVGFTYNYLMGMPKEMKSTFAFTGSFGYIQDIPFNQERTISAGIGLGFAFSEYYTNLLVKSGLDATSPYQLSYLNPETNEGKYTKQNKFGHSSIELPIQIRFRGAPALHKNFWKIHIGITPRFIFANTTANLWEPINKKETLKKLNFFNNWQTQATFEAGWGPISLFATYDLLEIIRPAKIDGRIFYDGPAGLENIRGVNVGIKVSISARKDYRTFTDVDGLRKTLTQ